MTTAAPAPGGRPRPVVLLLHGPNLNLLGERDPATYGTATLDELVAATASAAEEAGLELEHLQANAEADLVEAIHGARRRCAAIVVNAGALTHYAWSLHDALAAYEGVKIELHLSNPAAREPWRHVSVLAPVVDGSIAGFRADGYALAMAAVARLLGRKEPPS